MKLYYRAAFVFILALSHASNLVAQEETSETPATPTIADVARQERQRRKEFTSNEQTIALHTASLSKHVFSANILIVDSKEAIAQWVMSPQMPKPTDGQIRQVKAGVKFYMPFVVTNYHFPNENMDLAAQVRITDPDGKTLFEAPKVSGAVRRDPKSPDVIVLNPVMDLTFDEADRPGTYTIRVTVWDHAHSVSASTEAAVQLVEDN